MSHDNSTSSINILQSMTSMTPSQMIREFSIYYNPPNDFQIYHIFCKEITFDEFTSQLLNNYLNTYFHVFYFQHPDDKRIYQVKCEMISHSIIVQYLNLNICGIELNQPQRPMEFTNGHKENLELHLKQFLVDYLTPNEIYYQLDYLDTRLNTIGGSLVNISQQHTGDNVIFDQSSTLQQGNNNQLAYLNDNNSRVSQQDNHY